MKRKGSLLAGFFGVMFYVGFLVFGCGGVNVHMATPGQDDNLMTADQEIYYGHMMGLDSKSSKTNLGLSQTPNGKFSVSCPSPTHLSRPYI